MKLKIDPLTPERFATQYYYLQEDWGIIDLLISAWVIPLFIISGKNGHIEYFNSNREQIKKRSKTSNLEQKSLLLILRQSDVKLLDKCNATFWLSFTTFSSDTCFSEIKILVICPASRVGFQNLRLMASLLKRRRRDDT